MIFNEPMSYITALGTANPSNRISQPVIADFMLRTMKLHNGDSRKLKTVFRASGIEYRHSVLVDYGRVKDFTFYANTDDLEPFPGTEKRLQVFRQYALSLSVAACGDMLRHYPEFDRSKITHLISVCCTGMYAPGLDVELVTALKLPSTVQRTAINFMGCQAAFNALKIADALCQSRRDSKVLIVCTELCSLHFQRAATDDNLLANALFADGSAALLVEGISNRPLALQIEAFHNELATEGLSDMAWTIGDVGFEMRLSSYVPDLISKGITKLIDGLLDKTPVSLRDIQYYAIHPGGKKILEVIGRTLNLEREKLEPAYHVLKNYGNMSSPTVLFVLKKIIDQLTSRHGGERILSVAFGPGLTLESTVLRIETTVQDA